MSTLRLGDALATAARAVAANLGTYLVVCFVCLLPGVLLDLANELLTNDNPGTGCLSQLLNLVLSSIAQGALVFVTIEHLAGRRAPVGAAFSKGLNRVGPIVGTAFLTGLLVVFAAIPGAVMMAVSITASGGAEVFACCGLLFVMAPVVYVYVVLAFAIPAVVVEPIGSADSLRRSSELTKGHRVTVFLAYLVVGAVTAVVAVVAMLPVFIALSGDLWDATTGMAAEESSMEILAFTVIGFLLQIAVTTYASALATVMYARVVGITDQVDAEALAEVFR